ncbi:MAG: cytochrome c [Filimonas sp.]|nr:cytochrome c [Filimonas sp.]
MKKVSIITILSAAVILVSCGGDVKRNPGSVYMPDMAYSRAYETYSDHSNLEEQGIHYNNRPVAGTIARGEEMPFPLQKDAAGDTANYAASKQIQNPLAALDAKDLKEAERLYLVNCGICHGTKLDGNGPLYKDGTGPYPAAPKNLMTLHMPDGQMFYSVTYGKNMMGSYASQLSRKQRWMVIHYIKAKQAEANAAAAPAAESTDKK